MRLSSETGKRDCRIVDFVDIAGRASGLVSTRLFSVSIHLKFLEERAKGRKKEAGVGFVVENENDNPLTLIGEFCEIAVSVTQAVSEKKVSSKLAPSTPLNLRLGSSLGE